LCPRKPRFVRFDHNPRVCDRSGTVKGGQIDIQGDKHAEAAKGDQQAVRKLARAAAGNATNGTTTRSPADSDGDHDGSGLNVKAWLLALCETN
jgi:hypothetical protein